MELIREKFLKLHSEENVFSASHYDFCFDYSLTNQGVETTNQICLLD